MCVYMSFGMYGPLRVDKPVCGIGSCPDGDMGVCKKWVLELEFWSSQAGEMVRPLKARFTSRNIRILGLIIEQQSLGTTEPFLWAPRFTILKAIEFVIVVIVTYF